jgi:hypothetical protein
MSRHKKLKIKTFQGTNLETHSSSKSKKISLTRSMLLKSSSSFFWSFKKLFMILFIISKAVRKYWFLFVAKDC